MIPSFEECATRIVTSRPISDCCGGSRSTSSARFTADGPSSSIFVSAGTNDRCRWSGLYAIRLRLATNTCYSYRQEAWGGGFVFVYFLSGRLAPTTMDCLFDPGKLISATLADDTIRDDQPSVDDVGCKYRLRPLCLKDYTRGRLLSVHDNLCCFLPSWSRSPFKRTYFFLRFVAGYLDLLSQLTNTGSVTREMYTSQCACLLLLLYLLRSSPANNIVFFYIDTFNSMRKDSGTYYIIVIEDTTENCIVATGSLTIEKKFIHQCGQVRHNCSI